MSCYEMFVTGYGKSCQNDTFWYSKWRNFGQHHDISILVFITVFLNVLLPLLTLILWGRVTYICVGNLTIIGSDNGLSPGRCQAIIWTNVGLLLIGPLGTNFSEMLIEILTLSFKKMRLKLSSAKWRPFCFGLNLLILAGQLMYKEYG